MFKLNKGLTLIELLIVITIIGLLAGAFALNVNKYRARTRDSQRVADISTIQKGLALYFYRSDYSGAYPVGDLCITGADSVSTELINNGSMTIVPVDPINEGNYRYHYCSLSACTGESDDGISYVLRYYLETGAISGRVQGENTITP